MSSGADQETITASGQPEPAQAKHDAAHPQTYRQIAAKNINTLSEINRQLPKLLTWFAIALTQLTNNPIQDNDQEGQPDNVEARQATFRKYALYVGTITEEIRDELTKQINDLARYKVITKAHPKHTPLNKQGGKEEKEVDPHQKNGGFGDFDVGVLNARASSGSVGGEDVLDRIKAILEELKKHTESQANGEEIVIDG